jgi:hypothetical protein
MCRRLIMHPCCRGTAKIGRCCFLDRIHWSFLMQTEMHMSPNSHGSKVSGLLDSTLGGTVTRSQQARRQIQVEQPQQRLKVTCNCPSCFMGPDFLVVTSEVCSRRSDNVSSIRRPDPRSSIFHSAQIETCVSQHQTSHSGHTPHKNGFQRIECGRVSRWRLSQQ